MSTDTRKPLTQEEVDSQAVLAHVFRGKVALKMVFIKEKDAPLAVALVEDFRNHVIALIAPDLLPAEMGHALMRAERKGLIPAGQGKVLFEDFIVPCPRLYPYGDVYDRAIGTTHLHGDATRRKNCNTFGRHALR